MSIPIMKYSHPMLDVLHMGGCQNYGPFLDPYCNTATNIWATQKRTTILTTTHIRIPLFISLGDSSLGFH